MIESEVSKEKLDTVANVYIEPEGRLKEYSGGNAFFRRPLFGNSTPDFRIDILWFDIYNNHRFDIPRTSDLD